MLVRDFVELSVPFDQIAGRLVRDPAWLAELERSALEATALASVTRDGPGTRAPPTVVCWPGRMRRRGDALAQSLRWEANVAPWTFPSLDGELEYSPLAERRSRLVLAGQCPHTRVADSSAQAGVEANVRAFLERLGARLSGGPS